MSAATEKPAAELHTPASPELARKDSGDEKVSISSTDHVEAGSLTSWEGVHFTPQDVRTSPRFPAWS
jgi:hypothetical protein